MKKLILLAEGYNKREYWTKDGWDFIKKKRFIYIYPTKDTYRIKKPLGFGGNKIVRGGGWNSIRLLLRCTYRE